MHSNDIDISNNSTVEEIYKFLKIKFDLPENILEQFKENEIDGKQSDGYGHQQAGAAEVGELCAEERRAHPV